MVEFLKSRMTTFQNKPIGVVRVDTGGIERAKAEEAFVAGLDQLVFEEAVESAKKKDLETAKTLAIINPKTKKLEFEAVKSAKFSKAGKADAQAYLEKRYINATSIQAREQFAKYHNKNLLNYEQFNTEAQGYINGIVKNFKGAGLESFIPSITSELNKLRSGHAVKIMNDTFDEEDRKDKNNTKLSLMEDLSNLPSLLEGIKSATEVDPDVDYEQEKNKLTKDLENEIKSLIGVSNGINSPAAFELINKLRIAAPTAEIMSIMNKTRSSTAQKLLQTAILQTDMPLNDMDKMILKKAGITEDEFKKIQEVSKSLTDPQVFALSRQVSTISGVNARLEDEYAELLKNQNTDISALGFHKYTKKKAKAFEMQLAGSLGLNNLSPVTVAGLSFENRKNLAAELRGHSVLPESLHQFYTNGNPLAMMRGVPENNQELFLRNMKDFWNQISTFQQDGKLTNALNPLYKDTYKRMQVINSIDRVGNASIFDAYRHAFGVYNKEEMTNTIKAFATNVGETKDSSVKDIIDSVLSKTDIPEDEWSEFRGMTELLISSGTIKDAENESVQITLDNLKEVLNDTYDKMYQEDEGLVGVPSKTSQGWKSVIKNPKHQTKFTSYTQDIVESSIYDMFDIPTDESDFEQQTYAEDFFLMPDLRNKNKDNKSFIVVDADSIPILGSDGEHIRIDTDPFQLLLAREAEQEKKKAIEKQYNYIVDKENALRTKLFISDSDPELTSESDTYQPNFVHKTLNQIITDSVVGETWQNILAGDVYKYHEVPRVRDFQELGSRIINSISDIPNDVMEFIYEDVISKFTKMKPKVAIDSEQYVTPDVVGSMLDGYSNIANYILENEGYNPKVYSDVDTISVAHGFNILALSKEEIKMFPFQFQKPMETLIKDFKGVLKLPNKEQVTAKQKLIQDFNKQHKNILPKALARKIFNLKINNLIKQFSKNFPTFEIVSNDAQIAMIDHAYQHGFGSARGYDQYWKHITAGLSTYDIKERQKEFMKAGKNKILNFKEGFFASGGELNYDAVKNFTQTYNVSPKRTMKGAGLLGFDMGRRELTYGIAQAKGTLKSPIDALSRLFGMN